MQALATKLAKPGSKAQAGRARSAKATSALPASSTNTPAVVGETVRYEEIHSADGVRITKSNALIEANYRLSLMESRLLLICMGRIDSRLPLDDQRVFRVQASEFQARFGVGREKAYQSLKEIADRLFERKVEIRDPSTGMVNDKIRWVSRCKYLEGQGAVQLHFAPEILPYISEIRAQFTSYSLESVCGFSSTFAIRLYEILEQYRRLGKRTASVDDLRRWLDCADTFDRFSDFERWVIKVGVDQINEHSDLRVTYRKIKQGRTVSHIEFMLTRLQPAVLPKVEAPPQPRALAPAPHAADDDSLRAWRAQMERYGWDPDQNRPLPGGPLDRA